MQTFKGFALCAGFKSNLKLIRDVRVVQKKGCVNEDVKRMTAMCPVSPGCW